MIRIWHGFKPGASCRKLEIFDYGVLLVSLEVMIFLKHIVKKQGVIMIDEKILFRNYRCFRDRWAGFYKIFPVNVIIGKNNCGKSSLLDLIELMDRENEKDCEWLGTARLSEELLKRHFSPGRYGGLLGGHHWEDWGEKLVGQNIAYQRVGRRFSLVDFKFPHELTYRYTDDNRRECLKLITQCLGNYYHPLTKNKQRKISAERDIVSEEQLSVVSINSDGSGATNAIQSYINHHDKDRTLITEILLEKLNYVLGKEGGFSEITCQLNPDNHKWEVCLYEEEKGLISLSQSGSGLKTVILVLLNMYVIPEIENSNAGEYKFVFEELENNLHPSLLRRLLRLIEDYAVEYNCYFFLTTHSSVTLDTFIQSENAQVLHVEHDGQQAAVSSVMNFVHQKGVISDLGAKPADLLQANGIVWLEGPSDRVYFNRWVELYSDGQLQEGRDYQCALYGGSLLSNFTAAAPDTEEGKLGINLLCMNSNVVAVCDGDRTSFTSRIKTRVANIRRQLKELSSSHVWVTDAKEIESYIPVELLQRTFKKKNLPKINQYEPFSISESKRHPEGGYFQKYSPKKTFDKVAFAQELAPLMTKDNLSGVFELEEQMEKICTLIRKWNEG